ncbi:MAG: hypothetical protein DMG57_17260 [Acidobacteria bacterium]|nr:MAG: hypothetical protein DMG57_17260 [Acidobacteriota bacterium]
MKWLDETHGTKFELVRHFLARMLDGEWSSAPGQWQSVVVGAFALLFPAGVLLVREGSLNPASAGKYRQLSMLASPEPFRAAALADELALLTLVFAVTGLIALIQWQSFFPGKRDYLSLAGLPVQSKQIFVARFGTVIVFSAALVLMLNFVPSIVAPLEFGGRWQKNPSFLVNMGAQALSSGLGCFFVLFALVALQGLLLNILPSRLFARVSAYLQGVLIGVLLLAGLYSWSIQNWEQETISRLPQFGSWAPPVWFAGLHERLLGDSDPFFYAMGNRGLLAVLAAAILVVFTYLISYRRYRKLMVEAPGQLEASRKRQWSVLWLLTREPQQEAIMQFIAKTLARSLVHRVIWLAYIGAALGIVVNSSLIDGAFLMGSWSKAVRFLVLFWPLGTSVILLTGFRHVLSIPAELPSNWIFRITESQGRKQWMSTVERVVMLYAIVPTYVLLFPLAVHVLGWPLAVRMTLLEVLVSLTIFDVLFYSWQQLPFTCSYAPGKRPLIAILAGYIASLGVLVPLLSLMIRAGSEFTGLFPFYLAFFGGIWVWTRKRRRDGWGEAGMLYEDLPSGVPDLGIKEMSWRQTELHPRRTPSGNAGHADSEIGSRDPLQGEHSAHALNRPVAISLRLYRALARAFPHEFKNVYGEELLQVTEDAIEPIWQRHGIPGLARLLADIARRVPAEHLAELRQDLHYGLRTLAGSPGFTAVALISLSLGICIATCALSEMNGMVLRTLPGVSNPGELVALQLPSSYPTYKRYREQGDLFASTLAYIAPVPFGVSVNGHTERVWGHLVTGSYFSTLGVRPVLGRVFNEEQERLGLAPVVVVSYRFWQEHLGSDPSVIGKMLRINGHASTVIGVGPKEFQGASPALFVADLWMPLSVDARVAPELAGNALERRDLTIFRVVGRLKLGLNMARAEAELNAVAQQAQQDNAESDRNQKGRRVLLVEGGKLLPLRKQDLPFFTSFLTIMAGLVMLIACANVANMMLARAAGRRKEIALRLALGASRARIIRQLLTESMIVAAGAGVVGFLVSIWLMHLLSQLRMPLPFPVSYDYQPDGRVLLFTLALTGFTGLAFGLAPALAATRTGLTHVVKEGGSVLFRRQRRLSLRNVLMVSQLVGSLTLLVILGLLSMGIQTTIGIQSGFDPRNLYLIALDPIRDGYSGVQATAFFEKLLDRVKRLPSVTAASLTESVPVSMPGAGVTFSTPGAGDSRLIEDAIKRVVGKDYFDTAGIPIMRGRGFRKEDEANGAPAVIVSSELVREFWKGEDPVGRRIEIGSDEVQPTKVLPGSYDYRPAVNTRQVFQVVGVARDVPEGLVVQKPRRVIYFPLRAAEYARPAVQGVTLMVRAVPGVDVIGAVRREISAMNADITPFNARSMAQHIAEFMAPLRMAAWTYGLIGVFGLVLASVGLAGVTAYSVAQRGREIGIRMALGALPNDVLGLVMKEGLVLVTVGTTIGMACAWAGARLLSSMNSSVGTVTSRSTSDPVVLVGAPLLLAGLALVACYLPARRSIRIDPAVSLREE